MCSFDTNLGQVIELTILVMIIVTSVAHSHSLMLLAKSNYRGLDELEIAQGYK